MTDAYVGFADLPNQIHRQAVEKGFEFSLMVVGESGLGKSTLINSLFLSDVYEHTPYPKPGERIPQTVTIQDTTVQFEENGVRLRLTLVDSPGFGVAVDNSDCAKPLVEYIFKNFEQYMDDESRVNRNNFSDRRVHCCLYFISPTGHRLKELDIKVMKELQDKVNLVPLIAKSDTLTRDECERFRAQIMNDIQENDIKIFNFDNQYFDDEDEEDNSAEMVKMPFAISSSLQTTDSGPVRQYPWGDLHVEDPSQSEFTKLRDMLLRTHMQSLIDTTNDTQYQAFRLQKMGDTATVGMSATEINFTLQFEKEKELREKKMQRMEADMMNVFNLKVRDKEKKLEESEARLLRQHEEMKKEIQAKQKLLEKKREEFEEEKLSVANAKEIASNPQKLSVRKKTGVHLFRN